MRLGWAILCLIIGHNKILKIKNEAGCSQYFTLCTQCHRRWINHQLSDKPHPSFKCHSIKIRAHIKTVITNPPQRKIQKKSSVNFYLL